MSSGTLVSLNEICWKELYCSIVEAIDRKMTHNSLGEQKAR